MQRFINDADNVVEDMLRGYRKAHGGLVDITAGNPRVVQLKAAPIAGKVGLVTGGGSGHEPAFLGYVGQNMLDAAAIGEVFSSPTAQCFHDAFKAADGGAGVACLFGNYAGDTMNVAMAIQMAEQDGLTVKTVKARDDIASAPAGERHKRHGIAGGVFMWKIAGAVAAQGGTLDEVIAAAQKAADNTRSLCVGLSACTIPAVGRPNFAIAADTLEFGIGHHGEAGIKVDPIKPAEDIAREMTGRLLDDLQPTGREDLAVMLSGLGSTPLMELYILYDRVADELAARGCRITHVFVGNYVTSLDMNGVCLTLLRLDEELTHALDYPARSAGIQISL